MAKHVITGGPGSGKSTLVEHFARLGYNIVPETARDIIAREQHREKISPSYKGVFPWTNLGLFQELYVAQQIGQEQMCLPAKTYLLDRGLADPIAYAELGNITPPAGIEDLVRDAKYSTVFYLETVPKDIYINDPQRKEPYEMAMDLSRRLHEVYARFGLPVVHVPFIDGVDKRAAIVQSIIGAP